MIIGTGLNQTVLTRLFLKEPKYVSLEDFKNNYLYSETPITVFATKLDGSPLRRRMISVPGPSGNALYDYDLEGYAVMDTDKGFRTIVLENVTKFIYQGQVYFIR